MTRKVTIRETNSDDIPEILALYPQAFPAEELRPVVSALLKGGLDILSLAVFDGEALAAHVLFTICGTDNMDQNGALLAPLAVIPSSQRQGLGTYLVKAGLKRLNEMENRQVFVLGDPEYYQRFGFSAERQVLSPYDIPEKWADSWQSILLSAGTPLAAGRLTLPEPWLDPDLWMP